MKLPSIFKQDFKQITDTRFPGILRRFITHENSVYLCCLKNKESIKINKCFWNKFSLPHPAYHINNIQPESARYGL